MGYLQIFYCLDVRNREGKDIFWKTHVTGWGSIEEH
jgi:hypothetical protein